MWGILDLLILFHRLSVTRYIIKCTSPTMRFPRLPLFRFWDLRPSASSLYLRIDVLLLKIFNAVIAVTLALLSYTPFQGGWVVLKELLKHLLVLRENANRGILSQ